MQFVCVIKKEKMAICVFPHSINNVHDKHNNNIKMLKDFFWMTQNNYY